MSSSTVRSLADETLVLEALTYRGLQIIAQDNRLPGTLKKPVMVAMLRAKRMGDEELVNKIVEENRRYRAPPKQDASATSDKKTTSTSKRKGPGRPRRDETPEVPEKRAKDVPFSTRNRVYKKGPQFERMPSTQLHSTQPLLRALLDTTPSLEYTTRSVGHPNIAQPNLPFFNRPQNLAPPNLQPVPIFHNAYNTEHTPYYQYNLPPKIHNGPRYQGTLGQRDNIQQQPYPSNINEAGFNDFLAGNFNGHRKGSSAEMILPDMIAHVEASRAEQPRFNHENPLKYTHSLFNGGSEMRANMFNVNLAAQEGWNRNNRFQFTNVQDNSALRHMLSIRQRHVISATSSTTRFKDSGGIVISSIYERDRIGNGAEVIYNHLDGVNQVYDLSVPKPGPSQNPAPLAPVGTGIGPEDNSNYQANFMPQFVGSSQDVPYTQTVNTQGQQAPYEAEPQTYATLVNVRPPLPAYQNPQNLGRSQDAVFMVPAETESVPIDLQFAPSAKVPNCLEYLYNLRRDMFMKSEENKARGKKQNPTMTTTTNFYTFPLLSSRAYAAYSGSEATESSPEDVEGCDGVAEVTTTVRPSNGDQNNGVNTENNSWPSAQMAAFDRNLFTFPQIYDFLDAPDMVGEQFHNMDATAGEGVRVPVPANATHNVPLANSHVMEMTPVHPNQPRVEGPGLVPVAHSVGRPFTGDPVVMPGKFLPNSYQQVFPGLQTNINDSFLHKMISCPMDGCPWYGKLGGLDNHIFDIAGHKQEIVYGERQTFAINLDTLRETKYLHFLQQTFARIFVITVAMRGQQILGFLQEVPTFTGEEMKTPPAKGYLEIAGKDGFPYSWNGQIGSVYDSLMPIMRAGHCLSIHMTDAAFDVANCGILYSMVTL